jgi:lambda repressor-like predicted transcriptional regulator
MGSPKHVNPVITNLRKEVPVIERCSSLDLSAREKAFEAGQIILGHIKDTGQTIRAVAAKAGLHINTAYNCLHKGKGQLEKFIALAEASGLMLQVVYASAELPAGPAADFAE